MTRLLAERAALGLLTLLAVSALLFFGTNLLPGDVASALLGQEKYTIFLIDKNFARTCSFYGSICFFSCCNAKRQIFRINVIYFFAGGYKNASIGNLFHIKNTFAVQVIGLGAI